MSVSPSQHPPGYACRHAVAKILSDHYQTGQFLKSLFPTHLKSLKADDRQLAREISLGCLRWQRLLDYNIQQHLAKPPRSHFFLAVSRMTAYQIFFLSQVPHYAACHLGVELLKRSKKKNLAPVANAVFNKLVKNGLCNAPGKKLKALGINTSHPHWLLKAWASQLTPQQLENALHANNQHTTHWFRINTDKTDVTALTPRLRQWAPHFPLPPFVPFFKITSGMKDLLKSEFFTEGLISVQDPSAWFINHLLQREADEWVLDYCGAPGGKSTCLAELSGASRRLICADLKYKRIKEITPEKQRLGHHHIQPLVMDGRKPAFKKRFPKVLIDVPCSNLGVIHHRPEARWALRPQNIQTLSDVQYALLQSGSSLCAPGGVVVYATCSPDRSETADIINRFLAEHPDWRKENAGQYIPQEFEKEGFFWQYPGQSEMGGFFAARLRAPVQADKQGVLGNHARN